MKDSRVIHNPIERILCILAYGCLAFILTSPNNTMGQGSSFISTVGKPQIGPVNAGGTLQLPFITWGGDVATFHANGGLQTAAGSLFDKQGLKFNMKPGDDFAQQIRDYLSGKSPFLRGTFRMMGLASEIIGKDPRTKGVVIMQMTWSAGDHLVARSGLKTLSDLKGKTIVIQQGGPHIGMLDDILKTAQLQWSDIKIIWAKDLTGTSDSPAEILRSNPNVSACFAITPDMLGLCGGLENTGSGAEGTVQGAHVLVSTAELSRSIADVYVCRKDFYDANTELVTKFVAGYLRGCEELVDMKRQYEAGGSSKYEGILKMTQDIYGTEVVPVLEEAHGLISDCSFAMYPGNVTFFTQDSNLTGFENFQESALELAVNQGYAKEKMGLFPSGLNYKSETFLKYLSKTTVERKERFRAEAVREEIEMLSAGGELDDKTILSFTINFQPNQTEFSALQYGAEFQRVMESSQRFGNAVIAIRGHADPTKTLLDLVKAGIQKGILKRSGSRGNYAYSLQGRSMDLEATKSLVKLIEAGSFDGAQEHNPRETMQAALNLSRKRAEQVLDAISTYASEKGVKMDASQIQPVGVGIREPFIAKPSNLNEAKQNMRVEFRIVRVPAEATNASDFDF
ncbi:MAG: ABC transporter substrate-binding protein [Verrucomicrobiota bacterium]|jgi:outer membrane protein OmpA-like peptidoglycan-associated protein|nr:ABC transporter substrate-binding protein [Verrucomicrobiota bacterium]